MKLLIVLSLIACSYAAKLDRAYLPPSSAATAGGSPGSLNAPVGPSGSSGFVQPSGNSGISQPTGFGSSSSPAFGKSTSGPAFGAQPSGASGFSPSAQYGQPGSPAGTLDPGFSQPAQNYAQGAQDYQRNQPQRAQAAADQSAEILRLDNQNDGETFSYSFETSNGIAAEESGVATNGVQAQGAFSYSDDDGQNFRVTYTADENGYQPQGDHLPTPHPIPEEILKSIEQNAQAAAAGTQEGAYNPNEDNSGFAPQQYSNNAPTSYGQGPTGSSSFTQPQGNGASQLYGVPNAGATNARPQFGSQGFQPQGPAQQYGGNNNPKSGAPSTSPSNQPQKTSSQLYGSPSNGAVGPSASGLSGPSASGASQARPDSVGQNQLQPQGPSQQYSAYSRPGIPGGSNGFVPASNGFTSSGPISRPKLNQYQSPSQSGILSSGRPQGPTQASQTQDDSGYQYNKPQGSFGQTSDGKPTIQGPAGQFRPQNGAAQPSSPQEALPRPNSINAGFPSGPAQGSYGSSFQPNAQSSFGSTAGSNVFGPSPNLKQPSSIRPSAISGTGYGASVLQGSTSFGSPASPNSQSSFGPSSSSGSQGYGASVPQGSNSFGPAAGPNSQSSFGPSPSSGAQGYNPSVSQVSNSFGPSARPNSQSSLGSPSGSSGFGRPQGSFPSTGTKDTMPDSGYSYDRPGSQPGAGTRQPQGSFNAPSGPGQSFGGPRQPPSFSEEEGYKY